MIRCPEQVPRRAVNGVWSRVNSDSNARAESVFIGERVALVAPDAENRPACEILSRTFVDYLDVLVPPAVLQGEIRSNGAGPADGVEVGAGTLVLAIIGKGCKAGVGWQAGGEGVGAGPGGSLGGVRRAARRAAPVPGRSPRRAQMTWWIGLAPSTPTNLWSSPPKK